MQRGVLMSGKAAWISLAAVIIAFRAFLRYYPAFGGMPSQADRRAYRGRNPQFDGKQFQYPETWAADSGLHDDRISDKRTVPQTALPAGNPDFQQRNGLHITWMGHSSVLLQINGTNILIDPIFSERCFPLQWLGPKRFSHSGVQTGDLPEIHVLLLTHDHHDHLDPQTIRALDHQVQHYIVPLGVEKHLLRWGVSAEKIHRLGGWEQLSLYGAEWICTPTRHFSGRRLIDQNRTQWCSYVLRADGRTVFVSGDGGFGGHFAEIHRRFGDMDLALMECGQYNRRWHWGHLYPEESAAAAGILGAKCAMPVHWGAFVLSDHAWDDPPERFVRAAEQAHLPVLTPKIGETVSLDDAGKHQTRWWREIR